VAKILDVIVGALPLMGAKFWIARAAEPGVDRVGPDFSLAAPPRRGECEALSVPAAEPRPRSRARSRAA
jgi:hypothetical protein